MLDASVYRPEAVHNDPMIDSHIAQCIKLSELDRESEHERGGLILKQLVRLLEKLGAHVRNKKF